MDIALGYENVLPARGGCETYIADLAKRLVTDGHDVHLYACRWDETRLPARLKCHALPAPRGPRFLRPWKFGAACTQAMREAGHEVTLGFDKTWGQDVLYPQGGLHTASMIHNLRKFANPVARSVVRLAKLFDLAHRSFTCLERRQYLSQRRPMIVVNSHMVRRHFEEYLGIPAQDLHVVRSAIDPARFVKHDRLRRRAEFRQLWRLEADDTVALFAAMNYRLKGLKPLLHAVRRLCDDSMHGSDVPGFRLVVAGHPRFAAFEKLADRLGIAQRVRFIGPCAEMGNAYFASDFLVHPTFYDPCSLVVLEALACSLPVITTRYNGASELLRPLQEGYVIGSPHDHDRLAWAMGQLLDPDRRLACAQAARRAAGRWTFEMHYQQLLQVFEQAARRRCAA